MTDTTSTTPFQPIGRARKGVRGARFYRSSYGHAIEGLDMLVIIVCFAVTLHALQPERQFLALSLAQVIPTVAGSVGVFWTLRENDLYRLPARIGAFGQMLRASGSLIFALPVCAVLGAAGAIFCGRPVLEGVEEAAAAFAVTSGTLVLLHGLWGGVLRVLTHAGYFALNVVIVGATENAKALVERNAKSGDLNVLGIFDDRASRTPVDIGGAPILGGLDALLAWPELPLVDRVIVTVTTAAPARVKALVERLKTMPNKVVLLLDVQGFDPASTSLAQVADSPVVYVSGRPEDARRAFWKRVQDVTIGALALAIFSPIMILVAIAIKLDSPGSVFFRQPRHGFNNETIGVWKFRSMRADQADFKAERQTAKDDPRVTRIGRFIR